MKTQEKIVQLCRICEYRFFETIFNTGIEYLQYETCNDEFYVSEIAQTPEFWAWWKKIVAERNKLFLKEFSYSTLSSQELIYIWESLLNVRSLSVYPPAEVWGSGYEKVIKTLTQKVK